MLLGGAGRRMGRDKSAIRLADGRTMARRVADALLAAGAHRVVGIGGPPGRAAVSGLDHLPDAPGPAGPLAGLDAGLHLALDVGADTLVLLPCDLPRVSAADLLPLLVAADRAPTAVVVAEVRGRRHHPVSVWPADLAERVRSARRSGVTSFRALLDGLDVTTVPGGPGLEDADVPTDLGPSP